MLNESFVERDNRHHIQRDAASVQINQYSPYLLSIWKSAMDIQICFDDKEDVYLAKYLTKQDSTVTIELGQQSTQEHFKSRKVGLVGAVYDLLGYHNHRNSLAVIYINTMLPGQDERRQLLPLTSLERLPENSTRIFTRTHVQKYQDRPTYCADMSLIEYFTRYKVVLSEMDVLDDEDVQYADTFAESYRF